jgi:hypothetical protein
LLLVGPSAAEAVLFHVTPLGQVHAAKAFAVGAGAEQANARLAVVLLREQARATEEKASRVASFLESGEAEEDEAAALAVALEALLAAHLPSSGARSALDDATKQKQTGTPLPQGGGEVDGAGALPPPAPADDHAPGSGAAEEGSNEEEEEEEAAARALSRHEVRRALRAMLEAAETGDLHVVRCQARPADGPAALGPPQAYPQEQHGCSIGSESAVRPFARVVPRAVAASALRKLARDRSWWG